MAAVTAGQLLMALQQACYRSPLVDRVETQDIDADTLSARVYLTRAETFINVFYNITTDKTAFALVESGQRVYGVDNARKGGTSILSATRRGMWLARPCRLRISWRRWKRITVRQDSVNRPAEMRQVLAVIE